jgi:hypothetical protein
MTESSRDALARIVEQQDEQARRVLGMAPGAPLPPRAGVALPADPLDRPAETDAAAQERRP